MLKLVFANRRYSSWSLRGWLAARHSGLPFQEVLVNLYAEDWQARRAQPDIAIAAGSVPVLWDGDIAVWNGMAIIDWLDAKSGGARLWPADPAARAFALSAAMEMQAGFVPLRQNCPMNVMRHYPGFAIAPEAQANIARIDWLWLTAIERFGGPWLGGADFGGADIMYAPIASRLTTYDARLSPVADAYRQRLMAHPLVEEWVAAAAQETQLQPKYEF